MEQGPLPRELLPGSLCAQPLRQEAPCTSGRAPNLEWQAVPRPLGHRTAARLPDRGWCPGRLAATAPWPRALCGFCRRPTEHRGRKRHCPAALHGPHSHLTVVCRRGRCGPEQWALLSGHSGDRLQAHSGPKECLAGRQPS